MEDFTRPWIEGSDVADKIDFRIGDANEEAPKLGVMFDLAFVDGDKRTYIETYEMVMKILNPGGYILADNTLWDGHVIDPAYDRDHQTKGIRAFNDLIANDPSRSSHPAAARWLDTHQKEIKRNKHKKSCLR